MYKHKKTNKKREPFKDTAWKWFSKYVRLRDCLKTTGTPDRCKCITCGRIVQDDGSLHAGHAIPGRTNGILFDETIVFGQCKRCNEYGDGEKEMFRTILVSIYGEEWYETKLQARRTPVKISNYKLIADYYREKFHDLAQEE